jgi:hypothetical protein
MPFKRWTLGLGALVVALVAIFGWPDILAALHGARPANVRKLYALRREIPQGLARAELLRILASVHEPIRVTWKSPEKVLVWVPTGFMEQVYLEVSIAENRVQHADIRDDEGQLLQNAPPGF